MYAELPTYKRRFDGTYRVCPPEQTWNRIQPHFDRFGITRIADVTGLDTIGIPVAMAVRPLSATLAVSQGKGTTLAAARVSAAMESIEMWHAEFACPEPVLVGVPARELDMDYDIDELCQLDGSLISHRTPLSWVAGRGLKTGERHLVPMDSVVISRTSTRRWRPTGIRRSSNGLASGNVFDEAVVHAIYELIERDVLSALVRNGGQRQYVDLTSITDETCGALVELIASADVWLELIAVPNRWSVPCFLAYVWSQDYPVLATGSGAHGDSGVAAARAITEAVQTRLTVIAGSRDDLGAFLFDIRYGLVEPPVTPLPSIDWSDIQPGPAAAEREHGAEIASLGGQIASVTGREPIVVDLTTEMELPVVRVIAPTLQFDERHQVPRS